MNKCYNNNYYICFHEYIHKNINIIIITFIHNLNKIINYLLKLFTYNTNNKNIISNNTNNNNSNNLLLTNQFFSRLSTIIFNFISNYYKLKYLILGILCYFSILLFLFTYTQLYLVKLQFILTFTI